MKQFFRADEIELNSKENEIHQFEIKTKVLLTSKSSSSGTSIILHMNIAQEWKIRKENKMIMKNAKCKKISLVDFFHIFV